MKSQKHSREAVEKDGQLFRSKWTKSRPVVSHQSNDKSGAQPVEKSLTPVNNF